MKYTPATKQQILDKLTHLTDEEKVDLARNAASFLGGTKFSSPADLFHQTVSLLLQGKRHWPIQVGFCCYMRAAMKSVAGSNRELFANARTVDAPLEETTAFRTTRCNEASPLDALLERERVSTALRALSRARQLLQDDADALFVVEGWLLALSGEEIDSPRALSREDFESAKKRAMRVVRRQLPDRRD